MSYNDPQLELLKTSAVLRYENEGVPKHNPTTYDTPRRVRRVSPPQSLECSNNLSLRHYTVLRTKKPNSYQNDTQLNIDLGNGKSDNFKESKYETKIVLFQNTNVESEDVTDNGITDSVYEGVGYVSMGTINRRASSVDPSRVVRESTTNRRPRSAPNERLSEEISYIHGDGDSTRNVLLKPSIQGQQGQQHATTSRSHLENVELNIDNCSNH